jgi:hypothetical protein
VITLAHGAFEAWETRKVCGRGHRHGSEALCTLVKPGQRYGYDLIVHVGLRRYLAAEQREEIRAGLLAKHQVDLSTGTISALCDRFLSLFEALHIDRAPELRAAQEGGYPMHIDATCEQGKGGLCVSMDGWRGWVLWARRVDTEAAEHVAPIVEKTVELFGVPIATMRDLGRGPASAVRTLHEDGVLDLICHYHFLAAVGKQLFDKLHRRLLGIVRAAAIRTKLRALLADLQCYRTMRDGRFGRGPVRESLLALVFWVLEGDCKKEAPFPFALPHLELVRRCHQATEQAERWVPPPRTRPEYRALRHLGYLAPRLQRDRDLLAFLESLEERWRWFCELRDVLRLSNTHLPHGQPPARSGQLPALELLRLEQIKRAVEVYQAELEKDLPAQDRHAKRPSSPQGIILNALKRHGDQLFGHPTRIDADGQVIAVVERTNNIPEQFFGEQKRRLRRRLGRAHLGRDLEQQPAQVALVANLRSAAYVRVVCGSLDHLPAAIAALDSQASAKPATVLRDHRAKKLQHHVRKLLAQTELPSASRCEPRWPVPGLTTADLPPIEPEVETLANQATDIICNKHRFLCLADLAVSRTNNQSQRKPVPIAT